MPTTDQASQSVSFAGAPAPWQRRLSGWVTGLAASTPLLAVLAALLSLAIFTPLLSAVWRHGSYFDTDDAMRMVQVRDLLAGQGWYDLVAHRLNPPEGMLSHWSRVVDVPVAALVLFFSLFTQREQAEIWARLAFPLLLHIGYFAALFALVRRLTGTVGVIAAFVLAVLATTTNAQFMPGRIDHHAPQILLLVLMMLATVRLLSDGNRRAAWLLGGAIALSFAISIENMPFIAILLAVIAVAWACGHDAVRPALRPLGLSLLICAPLAFAATVPPARYGDAVADAYGIAHVTLLMLGGFAFALAGTIPVRTARTRWLLLIAFGGLCAGIAATAFPYLLRDPLTSVDPLVRRFWLERVREARPLLPLVLRSPIEQAHYVVPLLAGLIAAMLAVRAAAHDRRWPWIAIAALVVLGALGTLWQIRVMSSVLPFIIVCGAWAATTLAAWLQRQGSAMITVKVAALCLPFAVQPWEALSDTLPIRNAQANLQSIESAADCFAPSAYAPLRGLPQQLTLASIDLGPYVLAHTSLPVVAAAYHRNNRGNRLLIEAMTSDPDTARTLIANAGVKLIVVCPANPEFQYYVKDAPHGLAAMLRDTTPSWLTLVSNTASPLKILAVR